VYIIVGLTIFFKLKELYDYFFNPSPKEYDLSNDKLSTYPPDWSARKKLIIRRDGKRCGECNANGGLHLHHVIPLSAGGGNELENLRLLCESCHLKTHNVSEFSRFRQREASTSSKKILSIKKALSKGSRISFEYKKPKDSKYHLRTIKPKGVVEIEHKKDSDVTLCIYGFCYKRKADRTFAIQRMKNLSILD